MVKFVHGWPNFVVINSWQDQWGEITSYHGFEPSWWSRLCQRQVWVYTKDVSAGAWLKQSLLLHRQSPDVGALHTSTETRFTGSRSLIWIQCGLAWLYAWHADYAHCTVGLDLTHSHWALSCITACSSDSDWCLWRQSGLWIRIPDPHDPRFRVGSPTVIICCDQVVACTSFKNSCPVKGIIRL